MGLSSKDYRVVKSIEILKSDSPDRIGIRVRFEPELHTDSPIKKNQVGFYLPLSGAIEFGTQLANLAEKHLGESLT